MIVQILAAIAATAMPSAKPERIIISSADGAGAAVLDITVRAIDSQNRQLFITVTPARRSDVWEIALRDPVIGTKSVRLRLSDYPQIDLSTLAISTFPALVERNEVSLRIWYGPSRACFVNDSGRDSLRIDFLANETKVFRHAVTDECELTTTPVEI